MFIRKKILESTKDYWSKIKYLKESIDSAEAILIGAGSGLSSACGFNYDGDRFDKYFSDFSEKYGINDMYIGSFYPFDSLEEYWCWWSRHVYYNRYSIEVGDCYVKLLELINNKNYFVITTNVDHQFQMAGFEKNRIFYTQGDYGLFQCSNSCHNQTYGNESLIRDMILQQKDMRIPSELIPYCPKCGAPMTMNLRSDERFVEDDGFIKAQKRYEEFVEENKNKNMLLLELGVGYNTPGVIKYPFWKITDENENATYICINDGEASVPKRILDKSIVIDEDIKKVFNNLIK